MGPSSGNIRLSPEFCIFTGPTYPTLTPALTVPAWMRPDSRLTCVCTDMDHQGGAAGR